MTIRHWSIRQWRRPHNRPETPAPSHQSLPLDLERGLAEAEAVAVKRVIAWQIAELMKERQVTKTELARRMGTSRSALERLLDPDNPSVTLLTLERAAKALGKHIRIELAA